MDRRYAMCLALLTLVSATAIANDAQRSGKQIVERVCSACHAEGLHGAPRIGDREAWIARARHGMDKLVSSAICGHGNMPARGGMAGLLDVEMHAAVTFMVRESLAAGAPATTSRLGRLPVRSGKDVVMWRCARCHETGVGGAPRISDSRAWEPRMKQGLDAMVRAAIRGHGNMPARGGTAELTDEEMFAATSYMTGRWTVGR